MIHSLMTHGEIGQGLIKKLDRKGQELVAQDPTAVADRLTWFGIDTLSYQGCQLPSPVVVCGHDQ